MIMILEHDTFLCETGKSGEQDKQWRDRERKVERDRALQRKGFGVGNKPSC
jgi:hypothetical protein